MKKYKLTSHSTIFDAEILAILEGVKHFHNLPSASTISIFSDSLSSLQAIHNPLNKNPIVHAVKEHLSILKQKLTIKLHHIKSHNNNIGNELADHYANEARHSGEPINLPKQKNYVKKELERAALLRWNGDWGDMGQSSETFKWIPSVFLIPTYFPSTHKLTQILTGH